MSTQTVQGKLWSVAPKNWSNYFEPSFLPMYKKALEQLKLTKGQSLLDAGCGAGMFSSMAIKTGARVSGADAASGLLEVCRSRNPDNSFIEADLEALPFEDAYFDVVVGFNSFQYAGSFENAVSEAKRVLKPGGRLVLGIWDKPEMSEATEILKAIGTLLPPPPPGTPGPFALSEDGKIEGIFKKIGLKPVYNTTVACPLLYHTLDEAINSFMSTGPAAAATNNNGVEKVEQTIATAFQQFHVTEDIYSLQNQFLLFIAEK